MKRFYLTCFILCIFLIQNFDFKTKASDDLPGKNIFYNSKGKYGSCNHCHRNGGSAGRWNFTTESIDIEEGRKIPVLKGIGKRKDSDQIERSIHLMQKLFGFKLTNEQISQLVEYVGTL